MLLWGECDDYPQTFFVLPSRRGGISDEYAMIGMAHVAEGTPLYYDVVNEKGLAMAWALFAGNAVYQKRQEGKDNIPSWALLPWILGQAKP